MDASAPSSPGNGVVVDSMVTYNSSNHHTNGYSYRGAGGDSGDTTPTAAVSSTEPDFGSSSVVSSNHAGNVNVIHSTASGSLNQRRGSLQLWQFLVALLDEPAAR